MMNTADRSIAMVDYALRRRFAFYNIAPAFRTAQFRTYLETRGASAGLIDTIISRVTSLNARIQGDADLGPGFLIGHSFFCSTTGPMNEAWYKDVVDTEIRPLLSEYWFDKADEELDGITSDLRSPP